MLGSEIVIWLTRIFESWVGNFKSFFSHHFWWYSQSFSAHWKADDKRIPKHPLLLNITQNWRCYGPPKQSLLFVVTLCEKRWLLVQGVTVKIMSGEVCSGGLYIVYFNNFEVSLVLTFCRGWLIIRSDGVMFLQSRFLAEIIFLSASGSQLTNPESSLLRCFSLAFIFCKQWDCSQKSFH